MLRILQSATPLAFALVLALGPAPGWATEDRDERPDTTVQSDTCSFFRAQAFGRGLDHFSTEMLWACEAVEQRRAAEMDLSERMVAVDLALQRYQAAVVAAGSAAFARDRARQHDTGHIGTGDRTKAQIAETTGMLAALEAIRTGF